MKGDAVTSSDDECPSVSGDSSVVAPIFSKEKVCELKNSCYMKKKIISAIKKSLKTNNNKIHHTLTFNDVSVSEEKEIGNGCRQSLNIRIDLNDKLFYSSPDAASVNIETFKLNDSSSVGKCSRCSDKQNLVNDENASRAYFVCVKCGKREERRWAHDNCKDKCCRSTSIHCDNCLRFRIASNDHNFDVLRNAKFSKYMYVVTCPNGGGISLHMDYEKIMNLTPDEQLYVAKEFLKEAFKEDKKGFAQFTIAIVHNGSSFMPDLLKLLAELHPTLPVKTTKLKCDTETEVMDLGTYYSKVKETYNNGTFAFGPLNETQAASVKNDECGAYLPELLSLLERSPFLSQVLPWSTEMTTKRFKSPHESDDGPIFWCRPGEQIVSLDRNSKRNRWNADEIETFLKERQQNLKSLCEKRYIVEELKKYRRSYSSREFVFEDRTKPHADQVWGNHFEPTAAVGVIQAIHPDEIPEQNRACKEIVVFHARHFEMLEALLHIDVTAAPKQQCAEWLDDAKLNMIRQMNIRYSKLHLYDNDIYFIPRKIVHQFKTISATLSVAWHTRLIDYYLEPDPPIKTDPIDEPEEQAAHSDSSSSRSSSPSPVRKKTPAKKRKLSCSENESTSTATPKKKKKPIPPKSRSPSPVATPIKKKPKPRSRSSTPLKREKPTPKKKSTTKTPKKMKPLTLDEKEPDAQAPVHHKPRSSSRSDGEEKSKMSRSSSPSQRQQTRGPESSKKSPSRSRSRSVERTESNSSPPVVRKSVDDGRVQTKSPEEHRSASRDESKKNKSRSLSASPKRNEHDGGDASDTKKKKKSKRRSRSRSKSRKSENPSDTFGEKCASSSKKKKKERSRSPKKRDKSKESKNGRDEEKKSHVAETERHSSGKHKKHDRKDSFHSRSSSPAKKHDKNKKPRHRSRSPAKHEDDKMIEVAKETSAEDQLVPESPSHSFASRSTEKPTSPLGMPNESFDDERDAPVPESMATIDKSPVSQHRPHTPTIEMNGSPDPPSVIVKEEPRSPVSTQVRVFKEEPRSPCIEPSNTQSILEDRSSLDPVHCVKPEPQSPPKSNSKFVAHDPKPIIPDPKPMTPESKPMVADPKPMIPDPKPMIHEPKSMTPDPKPMIPDPKPMTPDPKPTEAESKKPTKTVGTVKEASTGKDHRKEKLWDTPLFSFNDCDKFVLTTRPNANKNGDKIVKSKTLNSLQKADGKRAASKSPPRLDKDRKSEPVKKTKSTEEKKNHASLDKGKSAEKARHADKKPSSSDHQQRSKDVPRKESHSSDKPPKEHDDKKSCHSSSHTKEKSADRAKEKSSHSRDRDIRKRSRSPLDKHHKHSKKHKKHRSASNSREAGNASKVEVTVDNADTATPTVVENEKTDEVANEPQSDENYAAGYRLVYPRIEIVDIGAKLKTKCDRVQDTEAESSCADEPVPVDETNVVELNSEDE